MIKKIMAAAITLSMLLSLAAVPAHAAAFSDENWAQYERGFYTDTSDFNRCFEEYTNTSFGDEQLMAVRMVGKSTITLGKDRNPVAYKYGQNAEDYGSHSGDKATYAHMRVYIATFSDEWRNAFDKYQIRLDKDGTGSSRSTFLIDTWKYDGENYGTEAYAYDYGNANAYVTKDWCIMDHQGKLGTDFGNTANDESNVLLSDAYDKLDIIVEYNKQNGATSYLFTNDKFQGSWYDSGLTDKHFHGIVFRVAKDKKIRGNSDYIAVKFDSDRIGHREYYNTDDYMVTLEDVMQDAGLGSDEIDSTMIYKSRPGDLEWYMPGNEQVAFNYEKGAAARERINQEVTYSDTAATITHTAGSADAWELAADMLGGFYPRNGKTGVSYESYHPRAKYVLISFDQTIGATSTGVRYDTYYSSNTEALKMWNNEGKLVIDVKGAEKAITTEADMLLPNHIDWLLEFSENEENKEEGGIKQYVFCNNDFVAEGKIGDHYATRLNSIQLFTRNDAVVTIDNWSMTVYNDTAEYAEITKDFNFGGGGEDPPVTITYGDVDKNGSVTAKDNAVLARYLASWTGYDETTVDLAAADVDTNGSVTAKDNAVLARHLASWTGYETLPYSN